MHFSIEKCSFFTVENRGNALRTKVIWTFSQTSSITRLPVKGSPRSQALFFSSLFAFLRCNLPFYVISFPAISVHSYTGLTRRWAGEFPLSRPGPRLVAPDSWLHLVFGPGPVSSYFPLSRPGPRLVGPDSWLHLVFGPGPVFFLFSPLSPWA